MDALRRPLRIPPSYPIYAEKHNVNHLFTKMLESLLVEQPADPLQHLVDHLKRETNNPNTVKAAIVGPPGAGKSTLADHLVKTTGAVKISQNTWEDIESQLEMDIVKENGFVLDGFPKNRSDCIKLQESGHILTNLFVLDGPRQMLENRQKHKKLDPETGTCYHPVLNWTEDIEIQERLVDVNNSHFESDLEYFRRTKGDVLGSYKNVTAEINADQPMQDLKATLFSIVAQRPATGVKRTARSIIVGPPGSGKKGIAMRLEDKWNMARIDVQTEIDKAILSESRLGEKLKSLRSEGPIPNSVLIKFLGTLLDSRQATNHGWVVYNFPDENTESLVADLAKSEFTPNRIILFNLDLEMSKERLSYRMTDPNDGTEYHQLYNPPQTREIKDRCVQRDADKIENITSRYENHEVGLETYRSLIDQFGGFEVNADRDPDTLFEIVESKLNKPLQTKFF